MKIYTGIAGFMLIVFGALILDTPIFALVAIPLFLGGVILLALFYDKILKKHNRLGLFGIIIICGALAYTAIEFNQFLVHISRDKYNGILLLGWMKIIIVVVLNLLASFFIYLALKQDDLKFKNNKYFGWWFSATFVIPFVLILKLFAFWKGMWLGE